MAQVYKYIVYQSRREQVRSFNSSLIVSGRKAEAAFTENDATYRIVQATLILSKKIYIKIIKPFLK